MVLSRWSKSSLDYGRRVVSSGIEGARYGREVFLHGRPLAPFLSESIRNAWEPAALGALLGVFGGCAGNRQRSVGRALACGVLGGAVGFGVALAWESRRLTASVGREAFRSMSRTRDEHWLETHPIDYA